MDPEAIPALIVSILIIIFGCCTQKMSQKYCVTYQKDKKQNKYK